MKRETPEQRLAHEVLSGEPGPDVEHGWYVIYPDGCAWVAVKIGEAKGVEGIPSVLAMVEEANASTHIAAKDRHAAVCEAIENDETEEVSSEIGVAVAEAYDDFAEIGLDPTACIVRRVGE